MQLQIGKKKIEEIENLIDSNCWKALAWIHAVLHRQLKYLFHYDKDEISAVKNHEKRWKLIDKTLCWRFETSVDLCYARNLICEKLSIELKNFNTFRNHKIGHPNVYEYLIEDDKVKQSCKEGIHLIKELDHQFMNYRFPH